MHDLNLLSLLSLVSVGSSMPAETRKHELQSHLLFTASCVSERERERERERESVCIAICKDIHVFQFFCCASSVQEQCLCILVFNLH
jgi:hypothetical protein